MKPTETKLSFESMSKIVELSGKSTQYIWQVVQGRTKDIALTDIIQQVEKEQKDSNSEFRHKLNNAVKNNLSIKI